MCKRRFDAQQLSPLKHVELALEVGVDFVPLHFCTRIIRLLFVSVSCLKHNRRAEKLSLL